LQIRNNFYIFYLCGFSKSGVLWNHGFEKGSNFHTIIKQGVVIVSMKRKGLALLIILTACVPVLMAQTAGQGLNGMGLNGATGLYSVPNGRIGWGRTSNLGLDFGYHTIIGKNPVYDSDYKLNHIVKVNASLFKWVELTGAFDFQPKYAPPNTGNNDLIMGFKVQLPTSTTAVAVGGNFQALNLGNDIRDFSSFQVYVALTYAGTFFSMPAETTLAIGKTFGIGEHRRSFLGNDTDFDFGMGFDLILFPKAFHNVVHWITDFSNFSYSSNPWGVNPSVRGSLNTGIRLNLAALPALSKFKFLVDVMLADIFDKGRAFSLGIAFGLPLL
jgi:hypothetical protein